MVIEKMWMFVVYLCQYIFVNILVLFTLLIRGLTLPGAMKVNSSHIFSFRIRSFFYFIGEAFEFCLIFLNNFGLGDNIFFIFFYTPAF